MGAESEEGTTLSVVFRGAYQRIHIRMSLLLGYFHWRYFQSSVKEH